MDTPNIIMFHRVNIHNSMNINKIYFKRKMVHSLSEIYSIIDKFIMQGKKPGSIEQCMNNHNFFHLSFDDGFKEHLVLAKLIKEKYKFPYETVSFSINVGNSLRHNFTGMDIVYHAINSNMISEFSYIINTEININDIPAIKMFLVKLPMQQLNEISKKMPKLQVLLINTFMNEAEIKELATLYTIISHGISHRFLTFYKKDSKYEIFESKKILENLINRPINTFCYPEGNNDEIIQQYCKCSGYEYGLSITHENGNKYCIGRIIK